MIALMLVLLATTVESQVRRTVKTRESLATQKKPDFRKSLPAAAKLTLDAYQTWEFDSLESSTPLLTCYVNNDTTVDYAIRILTGRDTERFLCLLSDSNTYKLYDLRSLKRTDWDFGIYYLEVFKRGVKFDWPPFQADGDKRTTFPTDCISISMRDKNSCSVFLFEKGTFKIFSPCD